MDDDVPLPVHTGYQPSQPDTPAWVSLTPAGEADDDKSDCATSTPTEPAAPGWEVTSLVTPETVARVARAGPFAGFHNFWTS